MGFGSSTPPAAMSDYTGFLMNWIGARSRKRFADAMEDIGLRPQQFIAMIVADATPGVAQQDLVAATSIDPSTMVATLDALEAAGLAERRPHPSDRRKRAVYLTAEGRERLTEAKRAAGRVAEETFAALEPAERAELDRLLRKLAGFAD